MRDCALDSFSSILSSLFRFDQPDGGLAAAHSTWLHAWWLLPLPRLPVQAAASLAQLKADGNSHFAKKEYDAAMACYDKALGLVPATAPDAALLHSNKAACHMMHKRCATLVEACRPMCVVCIPPVTAHSCLTAWLTTDSMHG